MRYTKNRFFTILGLTQSRSGPLGDIEGFVEEIPGSYKSDKPNNFTEIDKIHSNFDCNNESNVNGVREPILYILALDKPPGHNMYEKPRMKLLKKINKTVLSHFLFYLKDDVRNQ